MATKRGNVLLYPIKRHSLIQELENALFDWHPGARESEYYDVIIALVMNLI